ncbi:MAG TPA: hypothetical protein VIJ48_02915, partial [Acidimicrobiia bacterium]
EALNVDARTIQRALADLIRRGYIATVARHGRYRERRANAYDLSGLIAKATPYAEEAIAKKKAELEAKTRKAGPRKLSIVKAAT